MSGRSSDNSTDHNNESNRFAGLASSSPTAQSSDVSSWLTAQLDAVGNGSLDKIWYPTDISEKRIADAATDRREYMRHFKSGTSAIDDIGGLAEIMTTVWNIIRYPLDRPESSRHIKPTKGLILHGETGVGKTMLMHAIAEGCNNYNPKMAALDGNLYRYPLDHIDNNLVKLFNTAKQLRPSIIFLDMFEGLFSGGNQQVHTLASLMDDLDDSGSVFVVAATDRLDAVDPGLRKPGRFGMEIVIELPSLEARKDILCKMTKNWGLHPSVIDAAANATPDFTGADLAGLCYATVQKAIERVYPNRPITVEMVDFKLALRTVQSTKQLDQKMRASAARFETLARARHDLP